MSSIFKANPGTYKAGSAITRGQAVKFGSDSDKVIPGAANTDACIGVAQNDAPNVGDPVEVARPGGGAFAKAGEAVSKGKFLVSDASGLLVQTNASGDRIVAMADADIASGVIGPVYCVSGVATAADN